MGDLGKLRRREHEQRIAEVQQRVARHIGAAMIWLMPMDDATAQLIDRINEIRGLRS
jgi:hypothetical protein